MSTSLSFVPPVIAHRGASAYAPENTLAAFIKAAQLGIKWVEFDVVLAQCGIPIIFHDETLDRTTNAKGSLEDKSLAYLQTLDAGTWFSPFFAGERIPTLQQIIHFLQEMNMYANVELKPLPGQEESLVKNVLKVIPPSLLDPAANRILFSSFSKETLIHLRKYFPDALLGVLLHEWEPGWQTLCQSLNPVSVHVNEEIMTHAAVQEIKEMNKVVLCYTVNDKKRAKQLFDWGVEAVFSDMPDVIGNELSC